MPTFRFFFYSRAHHIDLQNIMTKDKTSIGVVLPTVLITGASRGIGASIAINLAESQQYKLALLARKESSLERTIDACRLKNPLVQIMTFGLDITDKASLQACITTVATEFGPYAVLINNAGIVYPSKADTRMEIDSVSKLIDINLTSVIHACSLSVPHLKTTKNFFPEMNVAIIQISSRAATFRATGAGEGKLERR